MSLRITRAPRTFERHQIAEVHIIDIDGSTKRDHSVTIKIVQRDGTTTRLMLTAGDSTAITACISTELVP